MKEKIDLDCEMYFLNFSLTMNSIYGIVDAKNKFRPYKNRKRFLILNETGKVTRSLFWQLVSQSKVKLFLECGANDAQVSREFLGKNPQGRALAIEANPKVFERFKGINVDVSNLTYVNEGISDKSGELEFYVPKVTDESISIFGSFQKLPMYDYYPPRRIKVSSLDEIIHQYHLYEDSVAIWIDVEGQVGKLLAGAKDFLLSKKCKVIYCEVQDYGHYADEIKANDIAKILWSYGFVPVARDFPTQPFYNLIFVRAESLIDIHEARTKYVEDLTNIKLPLVVIPDFREGFAKLKNLLLRLENRNFQKIVHSVAGFLGSKSSRKRLR